MRNWVAVVVLVGLAAGSAMAGEKLVFSSDVAMVMVQATVTARDGRSVENLAANDFEVKENGAPQTLTYFGREEVPASYILLVDVSGSMLKRIPKVVFALERFVGTVRPDDTARLVKFDTTTEVMAPDTSDQAVLARAVDDLSLHFFGGTALYEVLYSTFRHRTEEMSFNRSVSPRRWALIVLTDGKDESSRGSFRRDVIDAARRADLAVYPLIIGRTDGFLERLAEETGGRAFTIDHDGDTVEAYETIGTEVRAQYTLGYVPSAANVPDAWRKLQVSVRGRKAEVRHRAGYYVPGGSSVATK